MNKNRLLESAIVKGWQRVFNLPSQLRKGLTVLNVFPVPDSDMPVIITKVDPNAVEDMLMREWQYDLVEVDVANITGLDGNPLALESKPLMVVARPERAIATTDPILSYVQTCIKGCAEVSPELVDAFIHTTFLSDKQTTLAEWLHTIDLVDYFSKHDSSY